MSFYDVVVTYDGWTPDSATKAHVDSLIDEIFHSAPYNSALRATIAAIKDGATASSMAAVRIVSSVGTFSAQSAASDCRTALLEIKKHLEGQLRRVRLESTALA